MLNYRINKISLSSSHDKKYMLKYGCSRLSHLSHIKCTCWPYKNNFVKYKPFILIFTLSRTTVLFTTFFHAIKNGQ